MKLMISTVRKSSGKCLEYVYLNFDKNTLDRCIFA